MGPSWLTGREEGEEGIGLLWVKVVAAWTPPPPCEGVDLTTLGLIGPAGTTTRTVWVTVAVGREGRGPVPAWIERGDAVENAAIPTTVRMAAQTAMKIDHRRVSDFAKGKWAIAGLPKVSWVEVRCSGGPSCILPKSRPEVSELHQVISGVAHRRGRDVVDLDLPAVVLGPAFEILLGIAT